MARAYTSASSHKLQHDNAAVSDVPLTIACWARTASTATTQAIAAIGQRATNAQRYQLFFNSSGRIAGYCQNGSGTQLSNFSDSSGVNYAANTWYHAAVVFASTTSRTVYRDGGNAGSDTTTVTVGAVTTTNFGTRFDGAAFGAFLNGQTAEAGVWNVALSAAEIASLAKGVCPLSIRPEALVAYWPMYGNNSPEDDWFGNFDLTVTGATKAAHVRVIYPNAGKIILPAAAVGPTYTLTADAGSFSLSGQAAALQAGRVIAADSGSFALSGQAAGLSAGRKLLADAGSFTLTGQDAALDYTPSGATYTMTAEAGLFTLSGQAAALKASRTLTADHGSFTLSGQDAQFSYSGDAQAVSPAGRSSRKKRWAVEHNGRLVEFSTAQAAVGWLGRQNKKIKKAAQQPKSAVPPEPAQAPIPVSAITFDGVKLGRMMVDGQRAVDRIRTMRDADIARVERHIEEMQEEEDLIMRFIEMID